MVSQSRTPQNPGAALEGSTSTAATATAASPAIGAGGGSTSTATKSVASIVSAIEDQQPSTKTPETSPLGPVSAQTLPFKEFVWGAGMECSFIPHLNVDQYDWTQHNTFWREDLRRAKAELGITYL